MTKVTSEVTGCNVSCGGKEAIVVLTVLTCHIAKVTHVTTRQIAAVEGLFWHINRWELELVGGDILIHGMMRWPWYLLEVAICRVTAVLVVVALLVPDRGICHQMVILISSGITHSAFVTFSVLDVVGGSMVVPGIMVIGTLGSRGMGRICVIGLGGMAAPRVFRIWMRCMMVTTILL